MFASLLCGYRSGFMDPREHPIANNSAVLFNSNAGQHHRKSTYFSKDAFLKHSDKDTRVISNAYHIGRQSVTNQLPTHFLF